MHTPKEARSAELREKFETAVPSIQEKLTLEAERRQQQRKDNEELQEKLVSLAEQTRLRCTAGVGNGLLARGEEGVGRLQLGAGRGGGEPAGQRADRGDTKRFWLRR